MVHDSQVVSDLLIVWRFSGRSSLSYHAPSAERQCSCPPRNSAHIAFFVVCCPSQANSVQASKTDGRGEILTGHRAGLDHRMDVEATRRSGPHQFDVLPLVGLHTCHCPQV